MRSRVFLSLICCGFAIVLLGGAESPAPSPAPMTFDEVFASQRRFNLARFSPDGRYLLFSQLKADGPTFGLKLPPAQSATYVADLDSGRIDQVGGAGLEGFDLAFCEPWSADARFATLVTARDGVQQFGYWDQQRRRVTAFGPRPSSICGDWIGGLFLYRADLDGALGNFSGREDGLNLLAKRWRLAWSGAPPEITVHSSNPDFPGPSTGKETGGTGLVLADPATGGWSIIDRGSFSTAKPAPDGRMFAILKAGALIPDGLDKRNGRQAELQIYRIAGGQAVLLRRFPEFDIGFGAVAWSPDGRKILAAGRRPGEKGLKALVVEVSNGAVTWLQLPAGVSLVHPPENPVEVALPLGWVAGQPALIGESAGTLLPSADRRGDYAGALTKAYGLYGLSDGVFVPLTGFSRQSVMRFTTTSTGEGLVTADGGLWGVAPGRAPRRIGSPELSVVRFADILRDEGQGATLAIRRMAGRDQVGLVASGADGAMRFVAMDVATGEQVFSAKADGQRALSPKLDAIATVATEGWTSRLTVEGAGARTVQVANPAWTDRPMGAAKHITYKLGTRTLDGWVILPPNYSGGRVPALVWIYGGRMYGPNPPGSMGADYGETPVFNGQLWAAQGYAVIYPSTPIGYGFDSDQAKALAEAATAAVDAAAEAGWVDKDRAGIIGHSFGGYSVAAVLAERSDRFKAGVAISGIYDFAAAWGSRDLWQALADEDNYGFVRETRIDVEQGYGNMREPPWRAGEAYMRASPFYQVEKIKTPLLLMVGDLDIGRTSLQQTERFYAALARSGNPAMAVRYWGQGHVQKDPGAVRDQWSRASGWFARYLQPAGAVRP